MRGAGQPRDRVHVVELELTAALHLRHHGVEIGGCRLRSALASSITRLWLSRETPPAKKFDVLIVRMFAPSDGDLLVDALLRAGAGREHRDHGADADDDAEHRERRAKQIRAYRLESDDDDFEEQHRMHRRRKTDRYASSVAARGSRCF